MKVIYGTLPYDERYWNSLRVIKRNPSNVGMNMFGSSPIPIDSRQNKYNIFYVFGAPRGINDDGSLILPPNPNDLSPETITLLKFIFDVDVKEISQIPAEDKEFIADLKSEFSGFPESATPSLYLALTLANYVANAGMDKTNQIIYRWNAVANAIESRNRDENFDINDTTHVNPIELPEIIQMIISQLPYNDKLHARQVNRTWNASTTYNTEEIIKLLKRAIRDGRLEIVDRLLQDPRVDPSSGDDIAIGIASESGHLAVVDRLLQDPRVNPSSDNDYAIGIASDNGHLAIVDRLLQDSRVDPSSDDDYAIGIASENGHLAVVDRLLRDSRVDPSSNNNYAIELASRYGHLAVVERLLQDPRVDPSVNEAVIRGAIMKGQLASIDRLLKDHRVDFGDALRFAIWNGHLKAVDHLLQDPRIDQSIVNDRLIHQNIQRGRIDVVDQLLLPN